MDLYSTFQMGYALPKALYMQLVTSQHRHFQLCHSFMRGSHLLPSQLPGEHTGHDAASRCSEPIWNAHIPPIALILVLTSPTQEVMEG